MGGESKIETYFRDQILSIGGEVRKVKWIGRNGAPDRFAAFLGWNGFIEFKAPGLDLEPHQAREHERLKALGVRVLMLNSIEGVDKFIARVKRQWERQVR